MLNFKNEMNKRIKDNSFVNTSTNNDGAHKHKDRTQDSAPVAFYYYLKPNGNCRIRLNKKRVGQDLGRLLLLLGFYDKYEAHIGEYVHPNLNVSNLNETQTKVLLSAIDICIASYKKQVKIYW